VEPADVARRDVSIATLLAGTPDALRAHAIADAWSTRVSELPMPAREEVAYGIAYVRRLQGRLAAAAAMLEMVKATPRGGALRLLVARRALWLHAALALDRGALDETEQSLVKLEPFVRTTSLLRPFILATTVLFKIARGQLEWLERIVADVQREASVFGITELAHLARALGVELATLRGVPVLSTAAPPVRTEAADLLFVRLLEHRVKRGEPIAESELERLDSIDAPGLRPLAEVVRARAGLGTDADASVLLTDATSAIRDAMASGHAVLEAEARAAHVDILLALGRTGELRAAGEELLALAERIGSPRFALEARFAAAAASERLDFAVLEHLAVEGEVAPVAARRSRILLGGDAPEDACDRRIIEKLRARASWRPPEPVIDTGPGGEEPGWGIDAELRRVWLPGERWVDFARRPLHFELLLCLADAGGSATKEELVLRVWKETEYHPLRHDARLQVAIRKVRELIEEDPSRPERLVTTPEGYALRGTVRRIAGASEAS
jgi:hypothetical protein